MYLQSTNVLILILQWNPVNTVTNAGPMKNLPCSRWPFLLLFFFSTKMYGCLAGRQKKGRNNDVAVRRKVTYTYKHYLAGFVNKSDVHDKGYSKC